MKADLTVYEFINAIKSFENMLMVMQQESVKIEKKHNEKFFYTQQEACEILGFSPCHFKGGKIKAVTKGGSGAAKYHIEDLKEAAEALRSPTKNKYALKKAAPKSKKI